MESVTQDQTGIHLQNAKLLESGKRDKKYERNANEFVIDMLTSVFSDR